MRVLVIPDVHLKPEMFDEANYISKKFYDKIVCLGDLVDDWNQQMNQALYENTLIAVLEFDSQHPDMLWCWGNHDFSYRYAFQESGFSYMMISTVNKYIDKLIEQAGERFRVIHKIDNVLFSHAGLTTEYVNFLYNRVPNDIEKIFKKIDSKLDSRIAAHDLWKDNSPIWARPQDVYYMDGMYKQDIYMQVVGHTPVRSPLFKDNVLTLDTFSTYSDGLTLIGDGKFVIVDTEKQTWDYVENIAKS